MRNRAWRVKELVEFYPEHPNLLGLNYGRGKKICLRLRYAGDISQFLPFEQVLDTMLHELSHNVHGPHDAKFHALWDQLRDEHEALAIKGYTGEGFLSEGQRLGGGRTTPLHEARRLARAAAEKRRTLSAGSGQRLGGKAARPGDNMRRVIASAVDRRTNAVKGCGSEILQESQIRDIAHTATRNGFRTQAEEDAANDTAIAQALWELVQEDEKAKYGDSYIPPSAGNPTGNGGGSVLPLSSQRNTQPPKTQTRLADFAPTRRGHEPTSWTCHVCTLDNPLQYLCCDVCGTERSGTPARSLMEGAGRAEKRPRTIVDLT